MRVRSMLSFSAGAAMGAGWMYLKDPEHGGDRRRELRRDALRRVRSTALGAAGDLRRRGEELALAAVAGFEQGRTREQADHEAADRHLRSVGS
ncbi:hypothetical protein GCM10011354_32250 [Egicoccus halophilus]|uniref:YtxH-like protein n=1 Tax=Egicoccus halophilus TaxID=1670830 RepID=A0A8J3EVG1_9ACTN|nr:hypothetical protein GCM10011354_32250 [Egicoccus halophilus]